MADVLLAGILGAVVLAVVLLHKARQRDRKVITQLQAEVAAQKIIALTATAPMPRLLDEAPEDWPSEPARRKGHLALYVGGSGMAALVSLVGSQARSLWKLHRAATATVTAASVAVVGALILTPDSGTPLAATPSPSSHATRSDIKSDDADDQSATAYSQDEEDETSTLSKPGTRAPGEPVASTTGAPSSSPASNRSESLPAPGPADSLAPGMPPAASPSASAAPAPNDRAQATQLPAEDPSVAPDPDDCDGLVYVELPPLLDACLL